ncbi:MAG: electron transport complex subunit RsxC, partial [Thiohalomonadaceae bacterium]
DNKPEAFAALGEALQRSGRSDIELVQVPTRYPTGGEKQLIKVITGKEVPSAGLPVAIGVVVQNVATAAAVYRAIEQGEPLISRIVTVTGGAVATPHNLEVRIGTPVADLLEFAGGLKSEPERLVLGGPMMGIRLQSREVPITKTAGCVLAPVPGELGERGPTRACIRCGACAEACPVSLLPQQLYWHSRAKDFDKAQDYKLFDCIECGCCTYVCPSNLPLVQFFRFAKTSVWAQEREKKKADRARERHEFRQARIEAEKAEREARLKKKAAADAQGAASPDDAKKAAIQAALERAKAKKAAAAAGDGEQ